MSKDLTPLLTECVGSEQVEKEIQNDRLLIQDEPLQDVYMCSAGRLIVIMTLCL